MMIDLTLFEQYGGRGSEDVTVNPAAIVSVARDHRGRLDVSRVVLLTGRYLLVWETREEIRQKIKEAAVDAKPPPAGKPPPSRSLSWRPTLDLTLRAYSRRRDADRDIRRYEIRQESDEWVAACGDAELCRGNLARCMDACEDVEVNGEEAKQDASTTEGTEDTEEEI